MEQLYIWQSPAVVGAWFKVKQLCLDDLSPYLNFVALEAVICLKIVHRNDHIGYMCP